MNIEKLGITSESHGEVFCEMFEALIVMLDDWKYVDMYADYVKEIIEKATGKKWKEVKEILK